MTNVVTNIESKVKVREKINDKILKKRFYLKDYAAVTVQQKLKESQIYRWSKICHSRLYINKTNHGDRRFFKTN